MWWILHQAHEQSTPDSFLEPIVRSLHFSSCCSSDDQEYGTGAKEATLWHMYRPQKEQSDIAHKMPVSASIVPGRYLDIALELIFGADCALGDVLERSSKLACHNYTFDSPCSACFGCRPRPESVRSICVVMTLNDIVGRTRPHTDVLIRHSRKTLKAEQQVGTRLIRVPN